MPRISTFYGITIRMYFYEGRHAGRPHFHAEYGGQEASFTIDGAQHLVGALPPRAMRLVAEWARAHEGELKANWDRLRRYGEPIPIPPLK